MAKTEFFTKSTCIKWRVRNFFNVDHLESEAFMFDGLQWKFTLGREIEEETVSYYFALKKIKSAKPVRPFILQAGIETSPGNFSHNIKQVLNSSNYSGKKMLMSLLRDIDGISGYRIDDDRIANDRTLSFNLTPTDATQNEIERERELETETSSKEACVEGLCLDIQRLLGDGTQSDVTLKCENKTIPAHRLILSARSEVFNAMLQRCNMLEKQNGIVEITDMDSSILDLLLQFIYSGKLSHLSMDTAQGLYVAGDKYAIHSLKSRCSAFIKENLIEENACDILVLADIHSDRDLKERVASFIVESELLQKDDDTWLKFCEDHPKLANEVLNRAFKAKCVSK